MLSPNCPNCGSKLGEYDSYFCTACGQKLPEGLVKPHYPVETKVHIIERAVSNKEKKIDKAKWQKALSIGRYFVFLILFSLLIYGGIRFYQTGIDSKLLGYFSKITPKEKAPTVAIPEKPNLLQPSSLELELALKSSPIELGEFADYIPADIDIFFQGVDLMGFINQFISEDDLSSTFTSKAKLLLEDEYAAFSYKMGDANRWAFVFIPRDVDVVSAVAKTLKHGYWKFEVIGNMLIVANNSDVFKRVADSKNGIERNLSLDPEFIRNARYVDKNGQGILMIMRGDTGKAILRATLLQSTAKSEEWQRLYGAINAILQSKYQFITLKLKNG